MITNHEHSHLQVILYHPREERRPLDVFIMSTPIFRSFSLSPKSQEKRERKQKTPLDVFKSNDPIFST
jgi:hypothetical protein